MVYEGSEEATAETDGGELTETDLDQLLAEYREEMQAAERVGSYAYYVGDKIVETEVGRLERRPETEA